MPDRSPRIPGLTGLLLIVVPFVAFIVGEAAVLIWVADQLGWWTLAILLGTTLAGAYLLQREWRKAWGGLSESLKTGSLPPGRAADAVLVLLGGVLLIAPGFISDGVGLLLLLPFTRPMVRSTIGWWAGKTIRDKTTPPRSQVIEGEVIEGEVVPDSEIGRIRKPDTDQ